MYIVAVDKGTGWAGEAGVDIGPELTAKVNAAKEEEKAKAKAVLKKCVDHGLPRLHSTNCQVWNASDIVLVFAGTVDCMVSLQNSEKIERVPKGCYFC